MTYQGKVQGGVIVLDDGVRLPEGMQVRIEPAPEAPTRLSDRLLKHAGKATGLPHDSARNHEHYLYGTPKQ